MDISNRRPRAYSVLLLVVGLAMALVGLTVAPAQAAQQNCYNRTGPTAGVWSTVHAYNFGPGGWCMHGLSADPSYRLVWQADGNLVAYFNISDNNPRNARWSSGTSNKGATRLSFQVDGNLVIYNSAGHALWASGQSTNRNSKTTYRLFFNNELTTGGKAVTVLRLQQQNPFQNLWARNV